ncbi:unnamed protein product [Heligmosomoides polygyrus]|uniref:Uncharacterized protein n=1 Tax=Heligmosomoides polygyrus TaxID=6339 RepID=A0A183FPU2_HELPZ|nr:unnamed protein product [Heligmosomoides polygyrus]
MNARASRTSLSLVCRRPVRSCPSSPRLHPLDVPKSGASRFHRSIEERRTEEEEDLPWHGRQEEVTAGLRRGAPPRGHTPQAGPRQTLAGCCWGFP